MNLSNHQPWNLFFLLQKLSCSPSSYDCFTASHAWPQRWGCLGRWWNLLVQPEDAMVLPGWKGWGSLQGVGRDGLGQLGVKWAQFSKLLLQQPSLWIRFVEDWVGWFLLEEAKKLHEELGSYGTISLCKRTAWSHPNWAVNPWLLFQAPFWS